MGFLSGIIGSKKTQTPSTGLYAMPAEYQNLFKTVTGNANSQVGNINADMFRPMDITGDEQRGLDMFREGFAPTQESLTRDMGMLMNPFENFVVDDVNRQAQGDFSILKQNMNQAGQFGSNRQQLGANDIEQTRLGTIGKVRQQGYNTALDALLNNIIPQRQADATGMLGVGDFERNLNSQQKTAPLQAIQAQLGMLGGIPTDFGNAGSPSQTVKTGGGLGGFLSGLQQISQIAAPFAAMSDRRLKENIKHIGERNGFPVYEFNYIGKPGTYVGVMADEVERIMPEAVIDSDGYKMVNYGMIGFNMEEKHGDA